MLDHVFITVKDLDRSIAFYETALKPLGIVHAIDYDGKDGPEGEAFYAVTRVENYWPGVDLLAR